MTTKNTPVKFTKQKMIEDINSLRKITMEKQYLKSDLGRLFPALYCYKVVDKLIELGFLKFSEKQAKGRYYKWNFDTKVDLKIVDALFSSVLEYRDYLSKKSSEHRVMRIKKQELIKSQEKANLQAEEPILEPEQEMASSSFDLSNTKIWIGDNRGLSKRVQEKAFDLGWNWMNGVREIMNTQDKNLSLYFYQDRKIAFGMFSKDNFDKRMEREIFESDLFPEVEEVVMQEIELPKLFNFWSPDKQARYLGLVPTEEEIQGWKDQIKDLKNENFKLEREVEKIKNLFNSLQLAFDNYKNKVANHLEPTFVPKEEEKKPFVPVLDEIKKQKIENQKPTKYLKLFGYIIYEKN